MATGEDLRYPGTPKAIDPTFDRLLQKYINRVIHLISSNTDVFDTFFRVSSLLIPPTALFRPHIVSKVITSFFNASALIRSL